MWLLGSSRIASEKCLTAEGMSPALNAALPFSLARSAPSRTDAPSSSSLSSSSSTAAAPFAGAAGGGGGGAAAARDMEFGTTTV